MDDDIIETVMPEIKDKTFCVHVSTDATMRVSKSCWQIPIFQNISLHNMFTNDFHNGGTHYVPLSHYVTKMRFGEFIILRNYM